MRRFVLFVFAVALLASFAVGVRYCDLARKAEAQTSTADSVQCVTSTSINTTTSLIAAPGTGKRLWIKAFNLKSSSATGSIQLQDGSGGTTKWVIPVGATTVNEKMTESDLKDHVILTGNTALYAVQSGASVQGTIVYQVLGGG